MAEEAKINKGMRAYQKIDEETGEVYSIILYNEGHPQQIRANMKFGDFRIDETDAGRKKIVITPIAIREFRGQMFLKKKDIEKIVNDKTGKELEKSIKNWVEIYYVDENKLLSCTLFKTWGASELKSALLRPRPIKTPSGRTVLARPVFDITLHIGTKRETKDGEEFFVPVIEKVEETAPELKLALEHFAEDHKIYSVENYSQHERFRDTFKSLDTPKNWHNPKLIEGLYDQILQLAEQLNNEATEESEVKEVAHE